MTTSEIGAMTKANWDDYEGRVREVVSDPSNERIPRGPDAGTVEGEFLVMHNGLRVARMSGYWDMVLTANRGVHEPQEEVVFREVLKDVPEGGTMIELGAYWAFYSMWFAKEVKDARCYMIEPDEANRRLGQRNFAANGLVGKFFDGDVRPGGFRLDRFMARNEIDFATIVHADIQGAERCLLEDSSDLLESRRVGQFFISTHSQKLHCVCQRIFEEHGYLILASADFDDGTYCHDGVLVSRAPNIGGIEPIELPLRVQGRGRDR